MFVTAEQMDREVSEAAEGPSAVATSTADEFGSADDAPGEPKISLDELDRRIAELASEIYSATCRWLLLVAEFERRSGHLEWGFQSCSGWLAWRCGISGRAAREHVRVARSLGALPRIRRAFSRGEISYSKVRALTRAATEHDEAELLETARHATASQLERIVRAYRGAVEGRAAEQTYRDRYLSWSWEEDGSLSLRGSLPPEAGALLLRAIEAARDGLWEPDAADEATATNVDALTAMAETLLATGPAARAGGERYQLVVHVDAETLSGERDGGRCGVEDGSPLAAEAARRLGCDASVVAIAERDGRALDVGRRTRSVPASIGRALRARDGGCRFPGCAHRRFVDAHHIRHWARGGETKLDNLVTLCRRHHRLVHEAGYSVETRPAGRLVFRRPDGRAIPGSPALRGAPSRRPGGVSMQLQRRSEPPRPPSGEPMDLHHVIFALMSTPGAARRCRDPG